MSTTAFGAGPSPSPFLREFVGEGAADARWEPVAPPTSAAGVTLHTLRLASQTWRGIPWTHRLQCMVPVADAPRGAPARGCLLYVTGSGEHAAELALLQALATRLAAPVAVLSDVPNQPLFGDLREDALIAHTCDRFLREGDPSWPLLLPMTRAAVRAMDALSAFLAGERGAGPEGFVVAGASKRGWTTYLAAAADPRVRGIAPMVYDNLDMRAQMRRQREVFDGGYSPEIDDYTVLGLQERMTAAGGAELLSLVDPFAHRARLTMPKWLLLGTNDPYWPVDALSLYHDALPAPTFATYIPNAGHGLGQPDRIGAALTALWALAFPGGAPAGPQPLHAEWRPERGRLHCRVWGPSAAARAQLWAAERPTLDFREAEWRPVADMAGGPPWTVAVDMPHGAHLAAFAELQVDGPAGRIPLDTPVRVFGPL